MSNLSIAQTPGTLTDMQSMLGDVWPASKRLGHTVATARLAEQTLHNDIACNDYYWSERGIRVLLDAVALVQHAV